MRDRPDVVLVVWDTVRSHDVSLYAQESRTTPVLERLAEWSTVYERAQSASPWTLPSHASMFTGLLPSQHGANETHYRLEDGPETLAEALGRQGYTTVAVSANDMVAPASGLTRGFEHVLIAGSPLGRAESADDLPQIARKAVERLEREYRTRFRFRYDHGAARVNRMADTALSRVPDDRPVFLFLNLLDAHLPYWPPDPFRHRFMPYGVDDRRARMTDQSPKRFYLGESGLGDPDFDILRGLYRGEIAYLDARLGELVRILHARGRWEGSLLAVTSDHGENIGEHGLMDHQACVYQTLLSVPLMVRHPGEREGRRSDALVQTHDLAVTILAAAGTSFAAPVDAVALPDGNGSAVSGREAAVSEYLTFFPSIEIGRKLMPDFDWSQFDRGLASVREPGGLKLIAATDGRDELFDLHADPGETSNLIESRIADADRLRAHVPGWVGSRTQGPSYEELEMEEHLRALGYVE